MHLQLLRAALLLHTSFLAVHAEDAFLMCPPGPVPSLEYGIPAGDDAPTTPPKLVHVAADYFADADNCSHFYLCRDVDNGGSFALYQYRCPDGQGFDTDTLRCSDEWLLSRCGGSAPPAPYVSELTYGSEDAEEVKGGRVARSTPFVPVRPGVIGKPGVPGNPGKPGNPGNPGKVGRPGTRPGEFTPPGRPGNFGNPGNFGTHSSFVPPKLPFYPTFQIPNPGNPGNFGNPGNSAGRK